MAYPSTIGRRAGLLFALVVASIVPLTADAAAGASVVTFGKGPCSSALGLCTAIAVTPSGDIYAVNDSANQIYEFDANGNLIETIGTYGSGLGQFERPQGIAVGPNNDLWVTDEDQTQEFSSTGVAIESLGSSAAGGAVTVSPTGTVYVALVNTVGAFSPPSTTPTTIATFGVNGMPSSGIISALAYSPLNSDIYAVDTVGDRVDIIPTTGSGSVTTFGSEGTGAGQFIRPEGVAVDSSGNIYVTDGPADSNYDYRVQKFTPSGTYLGSMLFYNEPLMQDAIEGSTLYLSGESDGITAVGLTSPVASISASSSSPQEGATVNLSAASSYFPFGSISNYQWDLDGSGSFATNTGTTPTTSTSFSISGSHTISVKVTGPNGSTATAQVTINVQAPGSPSSSGSAAPTSSTTSTTGPPSPPPGPVGVSIEDGAYATDSPSVTLNLVWPAGTTSVLVGNDGGFNAVAGVGSFPIAEQIPWRLRGTAGSRLPTTVYVQFQGSYGSSSTYTDDIVLDETAPELSSAALVTSSTATPALAQSAVAHRIAKAVKYAIHIVGSDHRSGISMVDLSTRRSGGATVDLVGSSVRGFVTLSRTVHVAMTEQPKYARVRSAAGKWSTWVAITP